MDDTGPISFFILFAMGQVVPLALALGVLALVRWGHGGWDGKDWVMGVAAVIAATALIISAQDLRVHYLDAVGVGGTGVLSRKWMVEGDDSTSFKVAVQFKGYQDDFSVSEGFYDATTPPQNVPIKYDPDYAAEFVPTFRVASAWPLSVVGGLFAVAGLLELSVYVWVLGRGVDRFRKRA
ncbi:MAG: hypothetical protein IPI67_28260 [Myxococcales bacterium]|nr:hypothetical protein [Myxococcales bacterium]